MERWEKEAEFVLELMKKDEELMFSDDDTDGIDILNIIAYNNCNRTRHASQ